MSHRSLRVRYRAFITQHEIAWELTFGALAILFVVVGFLADEAIGREREALEALDLALTGVFVAEFASRLAATPDRRRYLRGHWIDLVALVPTVRGLRVARLLRLLRLVRAFAGLYRALSRFQRLAGHGGLVWMFSAWLGVMVLCSVALYAAENGVNKAISSPFDALWWGVVTLTTVGYGDVYPVTPEGRVAAMVLMVGGISLFAAMTAAVWTSPDGLAWTEANGIFAGVDSEVRALLATPTGFLAVGRASDAGAAGWYSTNGMEGSAPPRTFRESRSRS